jgi:FKBP-type peptidyl-prolyl cis-trans isomerase
MTYKKIPVLALAMFLTAPSITSAADLTTHEQKYSYALGYRLAASLKAEGLIVDADQFSQAINDSMTGKDAVMSADDMQAALQAERDRQLEAVKKIADKNTADGDAYRAANAKKDGVKVLDSGVQYRVITTGSGAQATKESTVTVNYKGALTNGTEFDSSYARNQPATFGLMGVIKGWQEVVPLMKEGDKWEVVIPPELGYAGKGAGDVIGPNETLVFEIDLVEVK